MTYDPNEILIELRSDSDWSESILFYTDAAKTIPRDLTGYTASAALQRRGSTDAAFLLATGGFLAIVANGVNILVPAVNTTKKALTPDTYDFFLVLISPSGGREEVASAAYTVVKGYAA